MSDVGRKVVTDKGRLSGERPVTNALKVSILHRKNIFHQSWDGEYEIECTQRDRMTGMLAEYNFKKKLKNGKERWLS